MKTRKGWALLLVLAAFAVVAAGCATTKQARGVEEDHGLLLKDYSILSAGKEGEALRVFKNKEADWSSYKKVLVRPVLFPKPEKATPEELADLQVLANNLYGQLEAQLGADYELAGEPGPNTLQVETAFFDASKKGVVTNFLSSVVPVGLVVSVVKDFATGKPLSVGEISGEAKVTDAQTGVLLGAALDHRVGQKYSSGSFNSWAEANDAMEYWAKRMRFAACQLRGGADCTAP